MSSGKRGDPWQGDGRGTTVGNGDSSRWHLATTQHTTSHAYLVEGSFRPTGKHSCGMRTPSTCFVVNAIHHMSHTCGSA
eukprot:11225736-Prorocentrum_lima.AAC.1